MTHKEFKELYNKGVILLDGATGTNLMKAGMPVGVCPEAWILDHKEVLYNLQKRYYEAGSDIVLAPTFTANRIKLAEYGLSDRIKEINEGLVALTKSAADECMRETGRVCYTAGDMTMTGRLPQPTGDISFEDLVDVYKEQALYLAGAGVDLMIIETMMSLSESRAALIAVKEVCDLPVFVTLSFNEDGRTLFGTDAETAMAVLQTLGADAVGVNCGMGPEQMTDLVRNMKKYANIPIIAKPNAGLPEVIDEKTVYRMGPEEFADLVGALYNEGAGILGGCCGSTPEHIKALADKLKGLASPSVSDRRRRFLSSERMTVEIGLDDGFKIIGERINPTGKKKMQEALRQKNMDYISDMAVSQEENGACILDINMGMNGIDEKEMMIRSIMQVTQSVNLPLCIDSSHVDVIEAALRIYPGRALVNSISLEKTKIEKLLPIARKYGAMFILLPLSDDGLPADITEKHRIIRQILKEAYNIGFAPEDIIVDGLVTTIGANKKAAVDMLDTISYCHDELGLATTCGLSNISFGLPERNTINTAFLTMAIGRGLTMAIANPSQEMLVNAAYAGDLLLNRPESDNRYIDRMESLKNRHEDAELISAAASSDQTSKGSGQLVFDAVMKGNRWSIEDLIKNCLLDGRTPDQIISESLIPAIQKVGELFEKKKYFLPQLIASAETMEIGVTFLEPLMKRDESEEKAVIVLATVEGDIHDIGKNLVALMLRNYGYKVIDLGKDVPKEKIIETAKRENARIIGLSALMTTTMMRMKEVVELAKNNDLQGKVIIGGAVTTQSFADEIGADGYSADAQGAVELVDALLKK